MSRARHGPRRQRNDGLDAVPCVQWTLVPMSDPVKPLFDSPMGRRPLTRQRSPWELFERGEIMGYANEWHRRRVHDGVLVACVAEEPTGWHLSISHRDQQNRPRRYPTWDEIAHARDEFLPSDLGFVMHLPPSDQYVALHDTTFHLHEHPEREL
jgi:hypothetical protein